MATKTKRKENSGNSRHVLAIILLLAILLSGIAIVSQSFERLDTYTDLNELRLQQDRELSEYSRLLIEKESLSSYSVVLKDAKTKGMVHPSELVKPITVAAE